MHSIKEPMLRVSLRGGLFFAALSLIDILVSSGIASAQVGGLPQSLVASQSALRFSIDTAIASMNGRFTQFSGKLQLASQPATIKKINVDIRISEVAIDPSQGFEYLSPETLFRTLPNPVLHFVSDAIVSLGTNRYRADGILSQGQKRWNVSLPFTAHTTAHQGTTLHFKLAGKLSELDTPMPLSMNPQRDRGSLEGRLVFSPAQTQK